MFVNAIENAQRFTRPIHTIVRYFGSSQVLPSAATLFFVNSDGWALTCRHVAENIRAAEELGEKYSNYKSELSTLSGATKKQRKQLQKKYGFAKANVVEMKHRFMNCGDGNLHIEVTMHPHYDLALIKFSGYESLKVSSFPQFPSAPAELKPGRFLCRIGFPFPEFSNFEYLEDEDSIEWTSQGRISSPIFPIEGMVTRNLSDSDGTIIGFELSTPGLRGQSGGPAFDADGRIWGIQAATAHWDLDFDVEKTVVRQGSEKSVKDYAFLHVGHCVHVEVMKQFMRENEVAFEEAE